MPKTDRPPIKVVAGLIFLREHLLICQRRAAGAFPLKWEFPGGKVEDGESDLEALRRELKEELAIQVGDAELLSQYQQSYPDGLVVSLRFFRVRSFEGEATNLVFEQIAWVNVCDLDAFDFLDGDRRLIAQLIAQELPLLSS